MSGNWESYDSVAESHERLAVAAIFAPPALDLVSRLGIPPGGTVLDVGTGTGVAALAAARLTNVNSVVIGLDPSHAMLQVAQSRGLPRVVRGVVPGLPFPDAVFDRVLANFVLSHLKSYTDGLRDMVRVLRSGGKLGITAWAILKTEPRKLWQSVAERFVAKQASEEALRSAVPWEERLADAGRLQRTFEDAGLTAVEVHRAAYHTRMSITDVLATSENSAQGRFMRQTLTAQRWEEFRHAAAEEFHRKLNDPVEIVREVHIAIGTKQLAGPDPHGGLPRV